MKLKLKASTLIETIAASVLISISFGIGTMVYFNVLVSSKSVSLERANYLMQTVINETLSNKNFEEEIVTIEGFAIQKSVSLYQEPDLYKIEIVALQNSKELASLNRLICIE